MVKKRGQFVVDKILDTAERLFYTQGYSNTGIDQVIQEADIAKASLYKHFDSKPSLMVAYLQRFHEGWFERLQKSIDKQTDQKKKLLALLDYHISRQQSRIYGGCPFVKANNEAGMSDDRILTEIQLAKDRLKKYILRLVKQSGHSQLLTDSELTETIYLLLEGGIVAGSIFKQDADLKAAKKILQKLI